MEKGMETVWGFNLEKIPPRQHPHGVHEANLQARVPAEDSPGKAYTRRAVGVEPRPRRQNVSKAFFRQP
jgi:hypothetical protein